MSIKQTIYDPAKFKQGIIVNHCVFTYEIITKLQIILAVVTQQQTQHPLKLINIDRIETRITSAHVTLIHNKIIVHHVAIVNHGTPVDLVIQVGNEIDHVTPVDHETRVPQLTSEDHVILENIATEHVTSVYNEILLERATPVDHVTLV